MTNTVAQARQMVEAWMGAHDATEAQTKKAVLIASELATNAIQANDNGAGDCDYTIELHLLAGDTASISISSPSKFGAVPPKADWESDRGLAERGRGLGIVDSISDSLNVERSNDGWITVIAELRIV